MVIKLTDAAKYYKALPGQVKAFHYLQELMTERELQHFAKLYRDNDIKPMMKSIGEIRAEHPITRKIVSRIISLGFELKANEAYIVGMRGMNPDLSHNDNMIDEWNDCCGVLYIQPNLVARFCGPFKCTTDSGKHYVMNPLNPLGAAIVPSDSYNRHVWMRGRHRNQSRCLIQQGNPITVARDSNKNGKHDSYESLKSGWYGINFHRNNNSMSSSIGRWSAGCTVTKRDSDHLRCMNYLDKVAGKQQKFTYILLGKF